MNRSLRPFCLLAPLVLTASLVSAQNLNPMFRHLPPNAERIYHINLPALTSKVSWQDIISSIPPSKSTSDPQVMDILKDPSQAGIDINQDIFIAQTGGGNKYDSTTFITVLVHLTDSGKFVAFARGMQKDMRALPIGKGPVNASTNGRVIGKDKMTLAYNDKLAVITTVTPPAKETAASIQRSTPNAKNAGPSAMGYTLRAGRISLAALHGFVSTPYITDPVFIAGFSDDADFHMWGPHGEAASKLMDIVNKKKALGNKGGIFMTHQGVRLHTLTALRFDAGKVTLRTTTLVPQDSIKNYRILTSRPLNTDLIRRLPGKALLGMINLHFDPSLLQEFLGRAGLRNTLDSALSSKGLTTNDLIKAFKGDFLIAGMQPATLSDSGKANPNLFFATTIGDNIAFTKLMGKLMGHADSSGNLPFGKMKTGFAIKDNILVVGKTKAQADEYFSNTAGNSGSDLINDRVRTNMFSLAVDVKAIKDFMQAIYPTPTSKTQQVLHFLGAIDRLTYTAGGLQNGQLESYFELKMADASENSLRSIFKLLH